MDNVKAGDNVLVIWNSDNQSSISNLVEEIKAVIKNGSVVLENSEMITECKCFYTRCALNLNIFLIIILLLLNLSKNKELLLSVVPQ